MPGLARNCDATVPNGPLGRRASRRMRPAVAQPRPLAPFIGVHSGRRLDAGRVTPATPHDQSAAARTAPTPTLPPRGEGALSHPAFPNPGGEPSLGRPAPRMVRPAL